MKLKYYIEEKTKEKVYTLKETHSGLPTKSAHYKFIKIKPVDKKYDRRTN